ncbi:hypothetical protein ACFL3S_10335 [Gemmatimonadota bacterium]
MTQSVPRYQAWLAELKRRRVFKTTAVFGGVAFVAMQAADFLVPALRLPEWVSTAIALLCILGFPVVLLVAWFFDFSVGGWVRTGPPGEGELEAIVSEPRRRRWLAGFLGLAGVLLLAGGLTWEAGIQPAPVAQPGLPPAPAPALASVAVLPFVAVSGEGTHEYLADGITLELVRGLSGIPGLRVPGRSSVSSPGGTSNDIRVIARELEVDRVLEGSVVWVEDRVQIATHLVRATDGHRLWTGSYDLSMDELFLGLEDIVRSVADTLGVRLAAEEGTPVVPRPTPSMPAYEDFLRGLHSSAQRTPAALEAALVYFNRAVLLDPEFSRAWAALAMTYVMLPESGGAPITEILPYARAACDRALAFTEGNAEAHAADAYLKWTYDWDLPGGEAGFLRSLELDPNEPTTLQWYAQLLGTRRQWDEGLEMVDRALELDPLSPAAHFSRGLLLLVLRPDEAAASLRRALELAPQMHPAAYILAGARAFAGDLDEAAQMFERFSSLTGTDPSVYRAYLAAVSDPARRPEAVAALKRSSFFGSVQGAELLAHLGETEEALSALEGSVQARSPYLPWINTMPQFESMRSDPRFQAIMAWIEL